MYHGFAEIERLRGMFVKGLHLHEHHSFACAFYIILSLSLPVPVRIPKTESPIRCTHRLI
jgi:hypothetical protein